MLPNKENKRNKDREYKTSPSPSKSMIYQSDQIRSDLGRLQTIVPDQQTIALWKFIGRISKTHIIIGNTMQIKMWKTGRN